MVKKCIIALAVVVLMVTAVQAGTPDADDQPNNVVKRDGDWPWTYKAIDLCTMPVYMDVGHYVQLKDCGDRKIHLKQVTCDTIGKNVGDHFPCYHDCEKFKVRANFKAIFGGEFTKDEENGNIMKDTKVWFMGDKNQILGSTGDWEELEVCLDAWKVEAWKAKNPDDKLQVGTLTITVKPPDGGTP